MVLLNASSHEQPHEGLKPDGVIGSPKSDAEGEE